MGSKYGMFSEPGYISVGDPYPEFPKISKRLTGLNFKATKINKNRTMTNDTRFEPLKPLWQKEPYELSNEVRPPLVTPHPPIIPCSTEPSRRRREHHDHAEWVDGVREVGIRTAIDGPMVTRLGLDGV